MASFYNTVGYCNAGDQSTTGHYAVTKRPQNTAVAAGVIRRQFTAPAVNSERCFVCIVAGTTANTTDATWVLTRGDKTTDGTATWQECTGNPAVNGDSTNTVNWTQAKALTTPLLGAIIKRNSGTSYQICTTAGTMGASEPAFSDTAGVTTNDGTSVWTSLGVVGNFANGGAPHARLTAALTTGWFPSAGFVNNTVYIADNHAESQATQIDITIPASSLNRILCHNRLGSYPPTGSDITTGASVACTGNNNFNIYAGGTGSSAGFYIYGITFRAGVGLNIVSSQYLTLAQSAVVGIYEKCSFRCENINGFSGTSIQVGSGSSGVIIWKDCTVYFASTITSLILGGHCKWSWQNSVPCFASGSSAPATFCVFTGQNLTADLLWEGLDLSSITGNIFSSSGNYTWGNSLIKDCKLNAAATLVVSGVPAWSGQTIQFIRSSA